MNKWQIICPVVAMLVVGLALGIFGMNGHIQIERRILVSAVTHQIDSHSTQIGRLLATMRGTNVSLVEDATFEELQTKFSTSLISRSMIRVAPTGDGHLECVIDTSSLGVPPRTIRSSQ